MHTVWRWKLKQIIWNLSFSVLKNKNWKPLKKNKAFVNLLFLQSIMYEIQNILSHCGSITYVLKHISVNLVISFEKHWLIGWHNEVHKELYVLFKCCIPIFLVTWMPHRKIPAYTFWPIIKWNVSCFQTASLSLAFPRWRCLLLSRVCRC